jgi:hypothetical protein
LLDSQSKSQAALSMQQLLHDQSSFMTRAVTVLKLVARHDWHARNFMERYSHVTQQFEARQKEIEAKMADAHWSEGITERSSVSGLRRRQALSARVGRDSTRGERELPMQPNVMSGYGEADAVGFVGESLDSSGLKQGEQLDARQS